MMKDGFIAYAHLGWVSMNYKQAFQETSSFNTLAPYDLAYGYIAPPPRQSRFGRTNAPLRDIWTQVDLNAFFNQSGLQEQAPLLPYIFVPQINDQNQAFNPLSWISSKTLAENEKHYVASKSLSEIELRNNHFQYLMFWFAMALIWGGFGAYGAFRIVRARRAT
jgi:cytochrome oxidase assembly protein ShyY1